MSAPLPLPRRNGTALFLDVDGTLLELASRPDAVVVTPALRAQLADLLDRLDGAVALISGRSLADLDRLFAPLRLPAAGVHGLERRNGDGIRSFDAGPGDWREAVEPALRSFVATHSGLELEDKGHALALHFRRAPEQAAAAESLADELLAGVSAPLRLLRGKMVLELLPAGADKGQAIQEFLSEPPFAGRQPVFIGDDVTDEAGFAAVNEADGISIRVGDNQQTHARHTLDDVSAVHRWLARLAADTDQPDPNPKPNPKGTDADA